MARNLTPINKSSYGDCVREADIGFIQHKLDHAAGMRICLRRFTDALDEEQVMLPKKSRKKLKELIKAAELFQNYTPTGGM